MFHRSIIIQQYRHSGFCTFHVGMAFILCVHCTVYVADKLWSTGGCDFGKKGGSYRRQRYTPLGSCQSNWTTLDPPTIPKAAQLLSPNSPCDSLSCFSSSLPCFSLLNADGSQSLRRGKNHQGKGHQGKSHLGRSLRGRSPRPNLESQNLRRANQSLQPSTMQSIA